MGDFGFQIWMKSARFLVIICCQDIGLHCLAIRELGLTRHYFFFRIISGRNFALSDYGRLGILFTDWTPSGCKCLYPDYGRLRIPFTDWTPSGCKFLHPDYGRLRIPLTDWMPPGCKFLYPNYTDVHHLCII